MHGFLRQSTAATIKAGPFLSPTDGVTPATALSAPASAASGATAGVALVTGGTAAGYTLSGWAHDRLGYYTANLSTGDTGTVGRLKLVFIDAANYAPVEQAWTVLAPAVYDWLFGTTAPLTDKAGFALSGTQSFNNTGQTTKLAVTLAAGDVSGSLPANAVQWGGANVTGMPLPTGSYTAPPTAAAVATAVLTDTADNTTAGSPGKILAQLLGAFTGTTSVFTTAALVNAPTGTGGSGGASLAQIQSELDTRGLTSATTTTVGTINTRIGAPVGASLSADIQTRSTYAGGPVALTSAGLDAVVVETGVNARQALSPILAAAAGVLAGAGTGTIVVKGGNVATTRITATTDTAGNRTAVTLSLPS